MRGAWSRPDPVDLVLALALTLALQVEIWAPGLLGGDVVDDRGWLSATSLLIGLPLAARRTAPWSVAVVALTVEVVQTRLLTPADGLANLLAMLLVSYSLGRWARPPARHAGIGLIALAAYGVGSDAADVSFVLLVLGAAWLAGVLVARRTDDLGTSELRRLEATRAGAEEERLRIARELHDVVAHRVSMMVVQSQLADTLLERDPAAARRAVRAVEEAGRDALVELRSVLGLLHGGEADAVRSPGQIDLARLDALVDDASAGGLPVTLTRTGEPRDVPPAVAMAAFRIVQESLTNVVKHAGSAPTSVGLTYLPDAVEVTVVDAGTTPPQAPQAGHGLAGMAERAAFVGGALDVGPATGSGFSVRALLPTPRLQEGDR